MMLRSLALLALPLQLIAAQGSRPSNFTVAFFPDDQGDSCDSHDILDALVLTTRNTPGAYTCFNVSDIFTQNTTSGFKNGTVYSTLTNSYDLLPGVNWTTRNSDVYSSDANYSRVWYEHMQLNEGDDPDGGSRWRLWLYSFEDCQQVGDEVNDERPWYETSCETEIGGECQTVRQSIKSFGIARRGEEGCEEWAVRNDDEAGAVKLDQRMSIFAAVLLMACFMVL